MLTCYTGEVKTLTCGWCQTKRRRLYQKHCISAASMAKNAHAIEVILHFHPCSVNWYHLRFFTVDIQITKKGTKYVTEMFVISPLVSVIWHTVGKLQFSTRHCSQSESSRQSQAVLFFFRSKCLSCGYNSSGEYIETACSRLYLCLSTGNCATLTSTFNAV